MLSIDLTTDRCPLSFSTVIANDCRWYSSVISASLYERSAIVMEHFVIAVCLSAHVSSGDTGEWIGMVSGVGLGMGVLDFDGDRRRGRCRLGVNTMQKWHIDRLSTRV